MTRRRPDEARASRAPRALLPLLAALLVLPSCGDRGGGDAPAACDAAQTAAIQASFEDEAVPGEVGAVAMVKDAACGTRYFTRGASRDVPETALHLIGSATKTYVASLVLLLAEDGVLSLSDPVSTWIPDVPGGDAVRVQHLLNHTSGIFNYTSDATFVAEQLSRRAYTPRELVDIAFARPLSFAPGADDRWEYSNTNYVLLGMIVERVTGRAIAEVLRERILEPIGARSTFFAGGEPVVGEIAYGESFLGTNGADFLHPSASWAAGNMVASIGDLVDWTERRGNGSFHSAATQAVLTNGVPTPPSPETPWRREFTYGAALVMLDESGLGGNGPAMGHGGDTVGYHTLAYYFPDAQATIALVVDSDKGPTTGYPFGPTYLAALYDALIHPYFASRAE
jgi:D-alanyl-D-alanine carboxypeptidase